MAKKKAAKKVAKKVAKKARLKKVAKKKTAKKKVAKNGHSAAASNCRRLQDLSNSHRLRRERAAGRNVPRRP